MNTACRPTHLWLRSGFGYFPILLVVSPLQGRSIIITLGIALLVSGRRRSAPQAGTIIVFFVGQLVPVLQRRQPGLHIIKFRSADHVLVAGGKDLGDLVLALLDTIRRLRM